MTNEQEEHRAVERRAGTEVEEMVLLWMRIRRRGGGWECGGGGMQIVWFNATKSMCYVTRSAVTVTLDADRKYATFNPTNCRGFFSLSCSQRCCIDTNRLSPDWRCCLEADKFSEMARVCSFGGRIPAVLRLALPSQQSLLIEPWMRKITLSPRNGCHSSLKSTKAVPLGNSIMGRSYSSVKSEFLLVYSKAKKEKKEHPKRNKTNSNTHTSPNPWAAFLHPDLVFLSFTASLCSSSPPL